MAAFLLLLVPLILLAVFILRNWENLKNQTTLMYRSYFLLYKVPGLHAYPIIGSAYQFKLENTEFLTQVDEWMDYFVNKCPDMNGMIKAWVGPVPVVVILSADYARDIMESNTLITKGSQYDIIAGWIGTGLLVSTNEKWFSRRKLLTPAFHFNVLRDYQEIFFRQGEIFADQLEKHADTGREIDLFPFIKRCALDIICETAMGTQLNTQTDGNMTYFDAVMRITDAIWTYTRFAHPYNRMSILPYPIFRLPWFWLKPVWYGSGIGFEYDRLVKLTNDFTRKIIAERRQTLEEDGMLEETSVKDLTEAELKKRKLVFLDLLLTMQKANALSDEDIREEVDTFMFEGHETTSAGIAWATWYLGQFPEYQAQVQAEQDSIFGDSDREPNHEDLKKMVYLERCIKESQRLRPSVPVFSRRVTHDFKLGDVTIPEHITLIIVPYATHRDPAHWERPFEFYPDHFAPEAAAARHPYAYFPFSAGPRNCIGQKFAITEMKTVLSWLFRRYKVESVDLSPGNRALPELILKPSEGIRVKLYKRRKY